MAGGLSGGTFPGTCWCGRLPEQQLLVSRGGPPPVLPAARAFCCAWLWGGLLPPGRLRFSRLGSVLGIPSAASLLSSSQWRPAISHTSLPSGHVGRVPGSEEGLRGALWTEGSKQVHAHLALLTKNLSWELLVNGSPVVGWGHSGAWESHRAELEPGLLCLNKKLRLRHLCFFMWTVEV